jgi:hypothetical protein
MYKIEGPGFYPGAFNSYALMDYLSKKFLMTFSLRCSLSL